MATGYRGTFVISWSQTEIDGLQAAPPSALRVGAAWSWRGAALRVDGPSSILQLDQAEGAGELRTRAARMVRRLVGAAMAGDAPAPALSAAADPEDHPLRDSSFVVTDGAKGYTVTLIETGPQSRPLLMFLDEIPPESCDLWVVHQRIDSRAAEGDEAAGMICFTPGTRILTPSGAVPVESLRAGDLVQTKDSGAQPIRWTGSRHMTGARLFAMPRLRPVRIRAGAFGIGEPDEEITVSPEHRMVLRGAVARALFNTPEVLVAARDLINGDSVVLDTKARSVTYHHLLLPRHEVLFANGLETESFHPANTALSTLGATDRARLLQEMPQIGRNPHLYGAHARRNLTRSEAAILLHEAA
jgi:hypothetical protein